MRRVLLLHHTLIYRGGTLVSLLTNMTDMTDKGFSSH